MKQPVYLLLIFFCFPFCLQAQENDSLKLLCPLNEILKPPAEQKSYSIGAEDMKAAWICKTDTIVKACISGVVTTILHDADGKWEVMFSHEGYSFWYSGINRTIVVKGQKIQNGEAMGYMKKGDKMELQMYDEETSLDPKNYLNCGN
ncbi:MAG: M23 family metallopeptidase [Bacteroidota bacterium]|nr:M23 family metallopeptidase [Bacteroidota bacterium]